jgi:hypothetical protein
MKNYRAFGLAISLMCLLAAPRAFASPDKDNDHDKDKHPAKESAPQPKSHTGSTHSSSGSGDSHSSSGQSHSTHGTSSSGDVKTEHSHETGDVRAEHTVHAGDSSHVHGTHDSSSSSSSHTHSASVNSHDRGNYHPVDHAHLHEVLHAHSGPEERARAFDRSHIERERFVRHAAVIRFVPAHRVVLARIRIVPTTYYYRRTVFYDTYGWAPAGYVYRMYPRYGLWDAAFLAFALDHIAEEQYALMIYHHRNEAEIQQWMDDSDRLAAENDDLRAKLENMKLQMSKMEEQGVAIDPSYVPPDAEDVALAPEVITALTASK